MNPYLDQLELAVSDVQEVLDDGKISIGEIFKLGTKLEGRLRTVMSEAEKWDDQDREYVFDASDAIYDKYIVPLDIPLVPERLEPKADQSAKWLLQLVLSYAMSRFVKDDVVGSALPPAE